MASLLKETEELGIQWRDPPKPFRRPSPYMQILELLKERPGVWAMIADFDRQQGASSAVSALRARGLDDWEFTSRRTGPNTSELFARYKPKRK